MYCYVLVLCQWLLTIKVVLSEPLRFVQLQYADTERYVTVYWPDGVVLVDSPPYIHASTFEVHASSTDQNQWQLRAVKNNLYLSAENGGGSSCTANRTEASSWETFSVVFPYSDNRIQLQTSAGYWLGVNGTDSSPLIAGASEPGNTETFILIDVPQLRGVNVGSWFVPEKWMFDTSTSELWAGEGANATDLYTLCETLGPDEATARMNAHWGSWFTEEHFSDMASKGVNLVRVPIGYWDIVEAPPYVFGGITYIDKAVEWAGKHSMSVLIDLHGAPGSQNGQDHSGHAGEINWDEPDNVALTVEVLGKMAARWANDSAVWGFEMLNEPHYSLSQDLLTDFYRDAYTAIRVHSPDTIIVMNCLYGPYDWTASVLPEPQYRNVVLDLHLYTAFSSYTDPNEVYAASTAWGEQIRYLTPYYPIIIGEMSLATGLSTEDESIRQQFADSEMSSFENNAFGFVFWSDKIQYTSEDWCFVDGYKYVQEYYYRTNSSSR